MGTRAPQEGRFSSLWAYNARILLGNTYWLIIVPIAATQLALFWALATAVLSSTARATQTVELLAPILAAFLCSHALAPEESGVGELVFIRPVSVERTLLLRLSLIFVFVLVILTPAFLIFARLAPDFSPIATVLATAPSVLILAMLAMVAARITRSPLLGFAAAAAYWALDVLLGGHFNPLVTLHGYADWVAGAEMSELWRFNKLTLVLLGGLLYLWHRRLLTRPAAPFRWAAAVRTGFLVVLVLVAYIASGAVYKVTYGLRHEGQMGRHARVWYQQQFRGYGPLPVARMFGPAFARYVQAESGRDAALGLGAGTPLWTVVDVTSMKSVIEDYPESMWADNAQFELAVQAGRRPTKRPWMIVASRGEAGPATEIRILEDVDSAIREYARLAERYPDSPFAPLALTEVAATRLRLLDFDGARPESWPAGLRLGALYLREGDFGEALRAADIAAQSAPWDRRAEAFILAARAARQSGQSDIADDRYERASRAAQQAVDRATRGEKTPSRVPKTVLFPSSNAIIEESERALSGRTAPLHLPEADVTVVGRLAVADERIEAVRVALGVSPAAERLPSPFAEGPATSVDVDEHGRFELPALTRGDYAVLACALRTTDEGLDVRVTGPGLPVSIQPPMTELLPVQITVERVVNTPVAPPTRPPTRGSRSRRGRDGLSEYR
jgi:hypothetical protein